jgi:steroid delta-isomerase-like uncharacterized protein
MTGVELVRAHLEAEDRRDVNATMATFTEQCWYFIPTRDYYLEGHAAVRGHYESLFASFPDLVNEEVELFDAGHRVFATMVVRRRHLGEWAGFPPTGRMVVTHALAEFPIAPDGLLKAEVVHMNPLEALQQIGACHTKDVMELALQALEPSGG